MRLSDVPPHFTLVQDADDVASINADYCEIGDGYDGYLAEIVNGDYITLFGFFGVPFLTKLVFPVSVERIA